MLITFWIIWFINQRAYTIMLCLSLLVSVSLSVLSVYSPPSHMVRHRNLGELYTDNDADANTDADNDGQNMIV